MILIPGIPALVEAIKTYRDSRKKKRNQSPQAAPEQNETGNLQNLVRFLLSVLTDTRFEGLAKKFYPRLAGDYCNQSHEPVGISPCCLCNPRRPDITALVADKYRRYSFFAWFARTAGAIWLDREKADFAASGLPRRCWRRAGRLALPRKAPAAQRDNFCRASLARSWLLCALACPLSRWVSMGRRMG